MKSRFLLLLLSAAGLWVPAAAAQPVLDPKSLTADLPFAMPAVALPRIPVRK